MTAPTPDPMPTFEPKWEAARISETVRHALDDYEQRIAAQTARIKELEEDAHIAETIIQHQNILFHQQHTIIKSMYAELAAAQQQYEPVPVPERIAALRYVLRYTDWNTSENDSDYDDVIRAMLDEMKGADDANA